HLEFFEELGWKRDLDKVLDLARAAKAKGHKDAELLEGKALLEKAIAEKSAPVLGEARTVLQRLAAGGQHAEAYWALYISYIGRAGFEKNDAHALAALEKGADGGDPSCMQTLAAQVELEPTTLNLTKARDLHLRLARDWQIENSKVWLRDRSQKAKTAEERQWFKENSAAWE
ncbi:MAG: hypothetical protein O3C21_19685, partial [Verrucomicrobia bacterium]|nr:hypothetical protein [Verrucomicrobiota bacterium]